MASTPSLIPYKSGYLYNVRCVNYTIRKDGSYSIHDENNTVKTRNFVLTLDENFTKTSEYELSSDTTILEPRFKSHILGLEDVRLFKDKSDNKYFFATSCEAKDFFCPRIVFGSYNDNGELLFLKHLEIPGSANNTCEKNWLPFVCESNEIRFIYKHNPLTIYEIDRETFKCKLVLRQPVEIFNDCDFRGSSCPVPYKNGWLYTIHQVLYAIPRKYYHRFVWYNSDFTVRKYGPIFYFKEIGIEYGVSLTFINNQTTSGNVNNNTELTSGNKAENIDNRDLIMTYSINDSSQNMVIVDNATLEEHLKFSDYLTEHVLDEDENISQTNNTNNTNNKTKICLAMIVKNESKIIERCLSSCLPLVDYICICDTGSTDNTVEIIEGFCKMNNIPGTVVIQPWKNFGYNRTLSYQTAKQIYPDADYCLLTDADMILKVKDEFNRETLTAGAYSVAQMNGALYYFNTRLLSTRYNWKCVGVTHEYWSPEDSTCITEQLETIYYLDPSDGGAKGDKFERDERLLIQGLKDEPDNERYMFYLAQTYHDVGRYREAVHWYRRRIKMARWFEEVYYSYYRIARCKLYQKKDFSETEAAYLAAWNYCKERMEPLYEIGLHYLEEKDYKRAYEWLQKASQISFPVSHVLFLQKDVYDYYVWRDLARASFEVKEYKTCVTSCVRAMKSHLSEPDKIHLRRLMKTSLEASK